jgi:formylglycine-generating enzyme required for sulfatase activity
MSDWVLATEQSGYTRHFDAEALPVRIGGNDADDIVLAEVTGSVQIGQLDDVFFVQPTRFTQNVRLDGELVKGSRKLADGSLISLDSARLTCSISEGRLRLAVAAQITAGDTAPPDFEALAQDPTGEVTVRPITFDPEAAKAADRGPRVRQSAILIYAAFVVLATLGWFAFTAKAVRFETVPVADAFEIPDTLFQFRIGGRYMLRPGQHRVTAELAEYYPIDQVVEVGNRADQTVSLEFVRLPGLISFSTEPVVGAEVRLDGELIGTTPLADYEIRPGTHQLQFTAERYLSQLVTIEVEGGHIRDAVQAELTPSWAPVRVSSRPAGAEIRVDGRLLGETPAELELTAGEREIVVSRAGYNSWSGRIRVVADEPQELPEVVLTLADARLSLTSVPTDAIIRVDGQSQGRTPSELSVRPNVAHSLQVAKPGYATQNLELNFGPGARESITVELEAQLGIVEVTSFPEGAEVLVNGEAAGTTPFEIELLAIEHTIAVRRDGFADAEQSITPRPGYTQRLPFELVPLNNVTGDGYPRVVTTSFGQNLRVIPAASFRMGATSAQGGGVREQARLRNVEITQAFYLAETEVTNGIYRRFCDPEHDSGTFSGLSLNEDDQPVVNITAEEAMLCMNKLSQADGLQPVYQERGGVLVPDLARSGYRLPTEAEFALAQRVSSRGDLPPLLFPWGDDKRPPGDRIENVADLSAGRALETTLVTYTDGFPVSAPVGSLQPNAAGLYDMGGNVAEWVQDFYDALEVFPDKPIADPRGPDSGNLRIVRGPSWRSAQERQLRLSYFDYEDKGREDIGFRIARDLD